MQYKILEPSLNFETDKGSFILYRGQTVYLPGDIATKLLEEDKIKPFCYWLKSTVEDCRMPCFEIDATTVYHECPHFRAYWNEKSKVKEIKRNE